MFYTDISKKERLSTVTSLSSYVDEGCFHMDINRKLSNIVWQTNLLNASYNRKEKLSTIISLSSLADEIILLNGFIPKTVYYYWSSCLGS